MFVFNSLLNTSLTILLALFLITVLLSLHRIGPAQLGLVTKRFGTKKLTDTNPVAFHGEAGYQADLLMPGLRWKLWPLFAVQKFPWVQIPAGEIGVVIAQVGAPLPIGAKSAVYKPEFAQFSNLAAFMQHGGQKGVQRPVLSPGTLEPIHPIAFLVITKKQVYGVPISPELRGRARASPDISSRTQVSTEMFARGHNLTASAFGLRPEQLDLVRVMPTTNGDGRVIDVCGVVTTFEGEPLPSGDIASRMGGFADLAAMESAVAKDTEIIETLLGSMNGDHNNYQDFQAFLTKGGKIGLQHDTLLYGAYALNPFLVAVEIVPMLVVKQGEVAVMKAYVGLVTQDTSGPEFKFGYVVRPGHRGIWKEPLRTGKYAINPRIYEAEIVPTAILTLNWADAVSQAHNLDQGLKQIVAKSNEGFVFSIDLQVQIHVPDTKAPYVISMVGTMKNLVNEVLQAAVGNHFRDKLQSMPAVTFIATRQHVQEEALAHITHQLEQYQVETRGVYIQDVILPGELVAVLTQREIANQEIETYKKQRLSQEQRIEMEQAKGRADMQALLAQSKIGVEIKSNDADARKAEAEGEATYLEKTGAAKGAEIRAVGLARAEGFKAQVEALGPNATALLNVATALAEANIKLVPDVLVNGANGGLIDGFVATLMKPKSKDVVLASPSSAT
jgi:hypothetical protein